MREIKFRAWQEGIGMTGMDDFMHGELIDYITHPGKDVILMQYTGLKDKNSVEIYEGDIVECVFEKYPSGNKEKFIGQVCWRNLGGMYVIEYRNYSFNFQTGNYKVIGNIHENPELPNKEMI